MSFETMASNLQGEIPGTAKSLIKLKLNEALTKVYQETTWSFQSRQGAWLASAAITVGSFTVTIGSSIVIADAGATAALAGVMTLAHIPFITSLQFRNPAYSLYNIIAADVTTNPPFATLTLDRPWMEPVSGAGNPYMIYQALFPAPVQDFVAFTAILDTTNNAPVLFTGKSQNDLAMEDPQRLTFGPCVPTWAVPWGVDTRPGSATLGYVLYELWPHVLASIPFTFAYKRTGPPLVNPTDTLPYPLTEDLLTWRTKEILYMWKEAQKGDGMQRGSGADWRFLAQAAQVEYSGKDGRGGRLQRVRALDANLHQDFVTRNRPRSPEVNDGYSTNVTGQLNVGNF